VTAEELAAACVQVMWDDDSASQNLGMSLVEVQPGRAVVSMPVRADMTNGHNTAHGGFIFALADSAFAFACNSHNVRSVAAACDIVFVKPAHQGELLLAEAVERHRYGRNGVYDVRVTRDGDVIAEFRGRSRTIGGALVETAE
jgi:phenylacetic acid degradation protein PaaD